MALQFIDTRTWNSQPEVLQLESLDILNIDGKRFIFSSLP